MAENGQGMTEFALILPLLLMLVMGIFAGGIFFHDWAQANDAAHDAVHAAAIHIVDGSGKSCRDRVAEALGDPLFIMVNSHTFTVSPCEDDPYWVGPSGVQVVGTWELTVNPPIPFIYSSFGFPMTVTLKFEDTIR
ncbi:MAG: TadE/TadG family type IV pilus assembly protein [bacterium]|nr:TadE/TadG family type IV pilus assembly protein [bacterium]